MCQSISNFLGFQLSKNTKDNRAKTIPEKEPHLSEKMTDINLLYASQKIFVTRIIPPIKVYLV